jgi:protocatechuate 3,4-dioxygenase alpha subunit
VTDQPTDRTPAPTPGQTVGPFFHDALPYPGGGDLVPPGRPGAIRLTGLVLDAAGAGVPDALVELRQAGPDGSVPREPGSLRRDGWTFTGWGRVPTDATGRYTFSTLVPGPTRPGAPPFFALCVVARGLLDRLLTRAYLPDDQPWGESALAGDPLLAALPPDRRATLLARPDGAGYRFDLRLSGDGETVFLRHGR